MNRALALAFLALTVTALGMISRRLATHRSALPALTNKINTRVTRINQAN
jgi:hypothetical protein